MIRVLVCLLMFGLGVQALGGGAVAVIVSGAVSLWINREWKRVNAEDHRRQIIADEQLRLDVMHRRREEGRE
jgi:uncharacterized membrane protein YfcA